MKVSIITPLYNSTRFLEDLLENLCSQTYENLELLFIDDGSTDETEARMKELMDIRKDDRIRYIRKENGGIADTKNVGIQHVTGTGIMFMDHDDFLKNDAVEKMVKHMITTKSDLVVANYERNFTYRKSFYERLFQYQKPIVSIPKEGGTLVEHKRMLIEMYQALWGKLYRKELFENFQFNTRLNGMDDLGSTSYILLKAKRISYIDEILYEYTYRKDSTIQSTKSSFDVSRIYEAYDDIYTYFQLNNAEETYADELEYLYIFHCIYSVGIRTLQRNTTYQEDLDAMYERLNQKFPAATKNVYYKKDSVVSKLTFHALRIRVIRRLMRVILRHM